jgi:hypothetical protein
MKLNLRALNANKTKLVLGLLLTIGFMLPQPLLAAGPAPIDLESAAPFAILATSTTTTTGGGIVYGDVGLSPAGSQGIPPDQIEGTIYNGGPVAAKAALDLIAAINAASPGKLPGGANVGAELSTLTLAPGVYQSPSGAYGINGVLTLFGGPNDVWVFQMASTLTTGVSSTVNLTGGAQARNVFWQVGSSATLGTSSVFAGTIMAYASITINQYSSLQGRALAQTGAVTYNGSSGTLPAPAAPVFTSISVTNANSATLVLSTTPYFPLTLQMSPDLINWTAIETDTPVTNVYTFTNTATTPVTQRFYQAFITPYP